MFHENVSSLAYFIFIFNASVIWRWTDCGPYDFIGNFLQQVTKWDKF